MMKKRLAPIAALLLGMGLAAPASAQCYADYQAGRGSPLQLHYGVVQIPDSACGNMSAAGSAVSQRISGDGWRLLQVISTFGPEGLSSRQGNAGAYFLRY